MPSTRRLGWLSLALAGLACAPYETDDIGQDGEDSSIVSTGSDTAASETGSGESDGASSNTGTDSSSADATGGSFADSDMPPSSCGEPCDIFGTNPCPEGEKCTAVACEAETWDSNVCRELQGTVQVGDECMAIDGSASSGNDTCAAGAMCWDQATDTGLGTCVAFCEGSMDVPSCSATTLCEFVVPEVLPLCLDRCDPLAQDCAGPDQLCIAATSGEGYVCVPDASAGQAPFGTPCDAPNACNAGLVCVSSADFDPSDCVDADSCCSPLCDLSMAPACPGAGQACEPVFDPQPVGFENVGVCRTAP